MKLVESNDGIKTKGVQSKTSFKIAANAKSFKVLIDSLYADKIKAPIRELSTNALDAHIDAGTVGQPFLVQLPTPDDPTFMIRDYGTGMSQKKIETLYVTVFDSDKDESNDFVGCLGLGSKSPFAYTNSFWVTSYHKGTLYSYIATVANGLPEIHFHSSAPTAEADGMAIGFAVEPKDIYDFHDKAAQVFKFFKHKPKVIGANMTFDKPVFDLEGDGWSVSRNNSQSVAIMGHIAYPIDPQHFSHDIRSANNVHPNAPQRYRDYESGSEYQSLLSLGLHMEFGIGEIEMLPSREGLQYNETTVKAIKARLEVVRNELQDKVSEKFKNCKNRYEANRLYYEWQHGNDALRKVVSIVAPVYNGVKLEASYQIQLRGGYPTYKCKIDGLEAIAMSKSWSNSRVHHEKQVHSIHCNYADDGSGDDKTIYLDNDIDRGAMAAARRYILDPANKAKRVYIFTFKDQAMRQAYCDLMGFDETYMMKASALPKEARKKRGIKIEKVFTFDKNAHGNNDNYWKAAEVDMEDGGVYVEINRYTAVLKSGQQGIYPQKLKEVLALLTSAGITVPEIVGVKTVVADKFSKYQDAEWVTLHSYIHEKLDEIMQKQGYGDMVKDVGNYRDFYSSRKYSSLAERPKLFKVGSDMRLFLDEFKRISASYTANRHKVYTFLDIANAVGYNTNVSKDDLNAQIETLEAKYPVLKLCNYPGEEDTQIVADYINKEN